MHRSFLLAARACFTCGRSLVLLGWITVMISSSGTVLKYSIKMTWGLSLSAVWIHVKQLVNLPIADGNFRFVPFGMFSGMSILNSFWPKVGALSLISWTFIWTCMDSPFNGIALNRYLFWTSLSRTCLVLISPLFWFIIKSFSGFSWFSSGTIK